MPFKKGETPQGAKLFKKGESGNPEGRPKGAKSRSTILKYWLEQPLEILNPITKAKQKSTVEHEVMLALIAKARQGDVTAIKEVLDTMYGKITDRVQIENTNEAARSALRAILSETGLDEEKARQIVAARFGISEQDLISTEVM